MKVINLLLVFLFTSIALTYAQTIATTSDGRKVVLQSDGTWSFVPTTGQATVTDFRSTTWGMSKSRVKALEASQPFQEQDGLLVFTGSISSLQTYIGYVFINDILTRARYAISEKHLNDNDYITDFNTLKLLLTKKYGAPNQDDTLWKDDRFKDQSDQWGYAISRGYLSYYASWSTPRTLIVLALYAESYQIRLMLDYTSVDYGSLEEAQELKNF